MFPNNGNLTPSCISFYFVLLFDCLVNVLSTMLNMSGDSVHPSLAPDLEGGFQFFPQLIQH